MDALLQDLRYALRRLRATPGFTAVAVFTLALGLGVNTMMFSIVNAILFPPQPVAEPDRVVGFFWHDRLQPRDGGSGISYPEFQEIAGRTELFESFCATRLTLQPLTIGGETIVGEANLATADCFEMLGVRPLRGRLLGPEDQTNAGGQAVAVISEWLWRTRFGGRDDAIGATVRFGGQTVQVVGVAPKGLGPELWLPLSIAPQGGAFPTPAGFRTDRGFRHFSAKGRLSPGVTLEQVHAQAPALTAAFFAADPLLPPEQSIRVVQPYVRETPWEFAVQLVLSGVVLFIACANLAGLLLVRGTARANELAVRLAIGAPRLRLVRQLLIESLLLALAGGLAAYVGTVAFAALLESLHVPQLPGLSEFQVDWRVLVFTLAGAVLTSVLFGLGPAMRVTSTDVSRHLAGGDAVIPGGHRRLLSVRSLLLVGQFAVSMLFVLVSGVIVAGFLKSSSGETGLGRLDAAAVRLEWVERPTPDEFHSFTETLRGRAQDREDLFGIAFASALPAGGATWGNLRIEGPGDGVTREGGSVVVSPGLLDALGIPLLRGRDFNEHDRRDTPRVALVSQTAAREWWPGEDPLGKRVYFHGLGGWHEVVGVAADTRVSLVRDRKQLVYLALAQQPGVASLVIGSSRNGGAAAAEGLRRLIHDVNPNIPVAQARTIRQWLDSFLYRQWLTATFAGTLAGLALFLASLGLYGSMAYAVSRRQRELGVRVVLGADARDIRRLVLWQGFRLAAVGAAVGLYGALLAIEAIAKITTAVPGTGVTAYLLGPAVMIGVALLAAWLPARRAARVDPMVTLRAL